MAIGTSNPVGSTDPRDLLANAENLDNLVNGASDEYPDRFSVLRKSWAYIESQLNPVISIFVPKTRKINGYDLTVDRDLHTDDISEDSSTVNQWFTEERVHAATHNATAKTTPVDADGVLIADSAASWAGKFLSMLNLYNYIISKLSSAGYIYITKDTYATMVALSSPSVGQQFICTDCNNSTWSYNGTAWKPINGLFLLDVMTDPVAIIPSGTINTGSSGQCSLGSNALDRAYPTGAWGIFPAIATTPAIGGGRIWFTCSASNTLTLYDGKNGSPINFTGSPVAFTGLTATQDLYSIAAMANLLPEGAGLRFEYSLAVTNSATGKIPQWAIGSVTGLAATTFGTAVGGGASGVTWQVQNFQGQARQSYTANPYVAPASTGGTAVSVVDMTAAQTFKFSLSKSSANDMASLHYMKVWCFIP